MYTPEVINYLHVFATLLNAHDLSTSLDRLNIGIEFDWLRLSPVLNLRHDELSCELGNISKYCLQDDFGNLRGERAERLCKSAENIYFLLYLPIPPNLPCFVLLSATYSSLIVGSRPPLPPLDLKASAFYGIVTKESHKFVSKCLTYMIVSR